MQQNQDRKEETGSGQNSTEQVVATNPNPRANENIEGSNINRNTPDDSTPDVGSEITDGEAS